MAFVSNEEIDELVLGYMLPGVVYNTRELCDHVFMEHTMGYKIHPGLDKWRRTNHRLVALKGKGLVERAGAGLWSLV